MFNKAAWQARFRKILSLDSHPGHISAGFAVGVFISFTPFFGLHTPLAIVVAFLFRLNKLTCITGAWVNTPLTVVPALGLSYKLGEILRGMPPVEMKIDGLEWQHLKVYAKSLLLGSAVIGFIGAIIGYFVCYWLVVRYRKRDESIAELTREMEETGEEIIE